MHANEDASSGESGLRLERLETICLPTEEARIRAHGVLCKCKQVMTITQNRIDVWRGVPTSVVDRLLAEGVEVECLSR